MCVGLFVCVSVSVRVGGSMIPLQTDGIGVLAHSWQGYPCFREKSKEDSCGMRDKRTSCVCVCVCVGPTW